MSLFAFLPLASLAYAFPPGQGSQHGRPPFGHSPPYGPPHHGGPPQPVAYFLDNNPAGSSIVSLRIGENGMLMGDPMKTSTGGRGSIEVNGTGAPFASDGLGSQGSVTVSGNMLFTVNAGSNTVSMFEINPSEPWAPKLVGEPTDTLGEFPISVDYSPELRKACVLNGGATAGVACFHVDPYHGLSADGGLRKLSSSIIDESTPPTGPPGSAAQVLFNPDSSAVFATVKGDAGAKPAKLGSLLAWPVSHGEISAAEPVVTQVKDLTMDFGFMFLSESTIFLSDPSFGASILEVGSDLKATEKVHTVIPKQKALCWTQYEPSLNTLYAIDASSDNIWLLNAQTGALEADSIVATEHGDSAMQGILDSAILNGKMYSLPATKGLLVFDLQEKKQIQFVDLSGFGETQDYQQGMAVWP